MRGECILAIDQGTTNTKALLFDRAGKVSFRRIAPVALMQPQTGWIEQDPRELWQSTREVMEACASYAAGAGIKIAGIAITNQRETALAWRKTGDTKAGNANAAGEPVCNAISWQCRRSEPVCAALADSAGLLQERTGLPLDPLLSATKWKWLMDGEPVLRQEAEAGRLLLGTVDTWLLYQLTGGATFATDVTNASRVALLNLERLHWDEEMLALFQIPRHAMAKLGASSGEFGVCRAVSALDGVPIVAMIGDSHAAMVGHGHYEVGAVKATYGTGTSLMMLTQRLVEAQRALARTIAWAVPGEVQYALEGNIAMSGAALQWVGEFLGLAHPADDAAALADSVRDAAGVLFVPAMVGLGAPHWDSAARGLIANLERTHTGAHLARAALDAIAMQVADVLDEMGEASGVYAPMLLADGGATRNRTLMQTQADMIGRRVRRSMQEELSARGAALLGGMALGWWKDMAEISRLPVECEEVAPLIAPTARQTARELWRLALDRTRMQRPTVACAKG